jgi:hypothetical protein
MFFLSTDKDARRSARFSFWELPNGFPVIACDKREAIAQGSEATKQSIFPFRGKMDCFAALAMTCGESAAYATIST